MPTKRRDLQKVEKWRRAQLIEAGFPRSLADRVARDARYDLHLLIELVEHGCSAALATRILEPAERPVAARTRRKLPPEGDARQVQLRS